MKPRVLITRESERAAELVSLLDAAGVETVAQPVTRTIFLSQDKDKPELKSFDWLIFTSANGVRGFKKSFDVSPLPAAIRVAAIGPGTAETITRHLRAPDFVSRQSDAASLARELIAEDREMSHHSILWPSAEIASAELPTKLSETGAKVKIWPVYRTEPVPADDLRARLAKLWPWHTAMFAAPSAVQSFAACWPVPWDFPCVAIGQVTAKALLTAGAKHVHVAASPAAADLRDAILKTLNLS